MGPRLRGDDRSRFHANCRFPAARSAPPGRGRGHRPRQARAAQTASTVCTAWRACAGSAMPAGANGPIRPSSSAPSSAAAANFASCSGRWPPSIAARMRAANSPSERLAVVLPHIVGLRVDRLREHGPGQTPVAQRPAAEGRDRGRQRRQRAWRRIGRPPHRLEFALRHAFDQRADQFDLAGEIAIERARRDAGALGNRRDLDRRHAARTGRRARGIDDGVVAGVEPANDVLGAAVGHANRLGSEKLNNDSPGNAIALAAAPAAAIDQHRYRSGGKANMR